MTLDLTQIILGITTLLSLCGWFVNGRKHRKETEAIDADNRQKEFELGRQYIGEFKENIVKPLQTEMKGLKNEVKKLHKIWWQQTQIHLGRALLALLAAAVVYAIVKLAS